MSRPTTDNRRHGMTLVEVLVAIGIILVLISMLLVVIPKMRAASKRATAQQQLNTLQNAIEQYYTDFRAYPGPLAEANLYAATNAPANVTGSPTMSENVTIGLLGGLVPTATGMKFDPDRLGKGAINLSSTASGLAIASNLASPPKLYLDMTAARAMLSEKGGRFSDSGGRQASDSSLPEFVDAFEEPLPILYLRARPGALGVMSDKDKPGGGKTYQYDLRQITPYTATQIGLKDPAKPHGLQKLGDDPIKPMQGPGPHDALPYLWATGAEKENAKAQPRQRDRFILISAGPDRIYGTHDDLTNFGGISD